MKIENANLVVHISEIPHIFNLLPQVSQILAFVYQTYHQINNQIRSHSLTKIKDKTGKLGEKEINQNVTDTEPQTRVASSRARRNTKRPGWLQDFVTA